MVRGVAQDSGASTTSVELMQPLYSLRRGKVPTFWARWPRSEPDQAKYSSASSSGINHEHSCVRSESESQFTVDPQAPHWSQRYGVYLYAQYSTEKACHHASSPRRHRLMTATRIGRQGMGGRTGGKVLECCAVAGRPWTHTSTRKI